MGSMGLVWGCGDGSRSAVGAASVVRAWVIFFWRAGMRASAAGGIPGSASSPASSALGGGEVLRSRTVAFAGRGVADQLGVVSTLAM